MAEGKTKLELFVSTVQVLSVVIGVVISVLSFNDSRDKDALARQAEAETRAIEAMKPLLDLRRSVYIEAVKTAAVIANPQVHSQKELDGAKQRFRELYVAELSMVEAKGVEEKMVAFAKEVDPDLVKLDSKQRAALDLAHALRDSFVGLPDRRQR